MIKKILCSALLFMLTSGISFAGQNPFPLYYSSKQNITIDCSRKDWPDIVPAIIESNSQIKYGERKNPQDFSVKIYVAFDAKNIYLYADYIDIDPLQNTKFGNDLYQGDSLEVYLGFRKEKNDSAYTEHDFQFGIGAGAKGPENFLWFKKRELNGADIKVKKSGQGFVIEARIPLSNFGKRTVKASDTIWLDFAANNGIKKGGRNLQMIWNGDGKGWQTPASWRKGKLSSDLSVFKKPYLLAPPEINADAYNRLYIWNNGKAWQGEVKINSKKFKTDASGGFEFMPSQKGKTVLSFKIDGKMISLPIEILKKVEKVYIKMDVSDIKTNQVGYNINDKKLLILTDNEKNLKEKNFKVVTLLDDEVVFRGKLRGPKLDLLTMDNLYYGDFSRFKTPGSYVIRIDGFNESYAFDIGKDVLSKVFYLTTRSYYLQRCGIAIDDKISGVKHKACHLNDGVLVNEYRKTKKQIKQDTTGGWHDAGDYGKYMPTAGVTTAQLMFLYNLNPKKYQKYSLNIPESKNKMPDLLDEIKYELDWMLKMQAPSGGVYHKVNTRSFPPTVVPEKDKGVRLIYEIGTADTAIFAGAMALAAQTYQKADRKYAARAKKAALKSGKFLLDNLYKNVFVPSNDNTGEYKPGDVGDELFWAFSELYHLTGNKKYYKAALKIKGLNFRFPMISWQNTYSLGMLALLKTKQVPLKIKKQIKRIIKEELDPMARKVFSSGYRVALSRNEYYWASNKNACSKGMALVLGYELFKNKKYLQAARCQLDYVLGVNCLSKSFITKLGTDYVSYPHHRYVEAAKKELPGIMVGGPNNNADDGTYKRDLGPRGYIDQHESYSCNEYAIDYNAPLVFLSGYFMKGVQYKKEE